MSLEVYVRFMRTVLTTSLSVVLVAVPYGAGATGVHAEESNAAPDSLGYQVPSDAEVLAEIDRVVNEVKVSARSSQVLRGSLAGEKNINSPESVFRCAEFLEGARYCLGYGWTTASEEKVALAMSNAASSATRAVDATLQETGDLSAQAIIDRAAAMSLAQRAAHERQELEIAARGIEKFIEVNSLLESSGGPISEESIEGGVRPSVTIGGHVYPEKGAILQNRVSEQERTYWCGPTTLQMMSWNWRDNPKESQSVWAQRLGTTTQGTAITDMVRVINTNFDISWWTIKQDSPYIVLDVGNMSYANWYKLNVNHYHQFGSPIVLHPVLKKKYYPYLDSDGSGHFQLGRGWNFKSGSQKNNWRLRFYEPWNQQRFHPSRRFIARKQGRWAKNSYWANKEHFQHNIGV